MNQWDADFGWPWCGSGWCQGIIKVLTVQVVLCHTYCSGGTSSNTLAITFWPSTSEHLSRRCHSQRLCAKVHLVQIVK